MPLPARRNRAPGPSDDGRNAVRRNVTGTPAEWAEAEALAARLCRRGYAPNLSGTLHRCVRAVLDAEARGLLSIEDERIYPSK